MTSVISLYHVLHGQLCTSHYAFWTQREVMSGIYVQWLSYTLCSSRLLEHLAHSSLDHGRLLIQVNDKICPVWFEIDMNFNQLLLNLKDIYFIIWLVLLLFSIVSKEMDIVVRHLNSLNSQTFIFILWYLNLMEIVTVLECFTVIYLGMGQGPVQLGKKACCNSEIGNF